MEVAKRVKRWWTASAAGKINLVVRYGIKPLEFSRYKNAVELSSEAEVANVPDKVRLKTGGLQKAVIGLY